MRLVLLPVLALAACDATDALGGAGGDTDTDSGPYAGLPAPAEPAAYSGTTCPKIVEGANDGFESDGVSRAFRVSLPKKAQGAGVLFLWHGNGDTSSNFSRVMQADDLAKQLHAIVVTPDKYAAPGDTFAMFVDWGVPPRDTTTDATLFDDVLSCLDSQYAIDRHRVFTAGFSAGALWSSWLVMNRADHLAAAVVFSGGTDGNAVGNEINPYSTPAWDIPVLLTEGGKTDVFAGLVDFHEMVPTMAQKLRADGSTAIVCSHTQGHTPPSGFDAWSWPFLDAHVYGSLPSPYADGADPSGLLPDTCAWE